MNEELTDLLSCSGTKFGGFCWHLSIAGESCTQTCDQNGGDTKGTIDFAGTGGTIQKCDSVLAALGFEELEISSSSDNGIGCYYSASGRGKSWDRGKTELNSSNQNAERVCSCLY